MGWTREIWSYEYRARFRYLGWLVAVLLMIAATAPKCSAQNWAETFNQKKTQKKYLLDQIAALQVYIGYARKGYQVASSGLSAVRDITDGEFSLHQAFISGLKKVSPVIRKDVRVPEIVAMQIWILKSLGLAKGNKSLSADQLLYVSEVAEGVISECYHDLSELLMVVAAGEVAMTDQERLARLDGIYERMADKSGFTQNFCLELDQMVGERKLEQQTLERLRRWYEID